MILRNLYVKTPRESEREIHGCQGEGSCTEDSHSFVVFERFSNIPLNEQRSEWRKEEENNRVGGDGERG